MTNTQIEGPHHQSLIPENKQLWIHKEPPDSLYMRKLILSKVVEIGVQTLFTTFTYTFNGKLYHQQEGAPIGTRIACAAANLEMEWTWQRMKQIFKESSRMASSISSTPTHQGPEV